MRSKTYHAGALFALVILCSACSDLGTDPWAGWIKYDLSDAWISIPPEFQYQTPLGTFQSNPTWVGSVHGRRFRIEAYLHEALFYFDRYEKQPITLHGTPGVMFKGIGSLHVHDSYVGHLIGVRVQFKRDREPLVVVILVETPDDYPFAKRILISVTPRP